MSISQNNIKLAILVMSGKGGVGKSTVSSQLALSLVMKGKRVGLIDIDICGPNLARMLAREDGEIVQGDQGWMPVKVKDNLELYLMSMAFLINDKNSAVIWRGPKKHGMVERFITGVSWGDLDLLIIDTPPGTSDEHISLVELLRETRIPMKVVLVTTPQIVACNDVRREISFCRTSDIEIAGLIENMSGFICPNCSECTNIFSSKGGQALCQLAGIPFLGSIPVDPKLCECVETGLNFIELFNDSSASVVLKHLAGTLIDGG